MLKVNQADVYTDFNGLAKLKNDAKHDSQEALEEVAKQFESIFLNMALKSMRDANLSEGIMDNDQSKFFQEMYDQQLAVHLSGDPGMGLADMIVRQLGTENRFKTDDQLNLNDYQHQPLTLSEVKQADPKAEIKVKSGENLPINSVTQFVKQLWPYARKAASEIGVEPKVLLAQAALETGWGKAVINKTNGESSFNLFNIKADKSWQGDKANKNTVEFEQGITKQTLAPFRVYDSYQDSFKDYVQFIKNNPRYGEALQQTDNPERYVKALQKAGYATDPDYADKIMRIFNSKTLAQHEPGPILARN